MDYYGGYLDAQRIVELWDDGGVEDWVCSELEVFECQIGIIQRPDITGNILGVPTSDQSIDLQRKVYAKLAQLTKLRELTSGFPTDTTLNMYERVCYRQYDCLAMTLESGLDLLKGLKELRVVELEDMEVYISGEKEQSWFAEHWPLATIRVTDYTMDRDEDD
ncbi:hypothetical protein BGZ96_003450 [Linnemannia gamsii]|uniref:Uncharacterized protein n=1 Tax=Linnemannia gamsii TaxID=64522 RepID=A0ABQ7K6X1_9FUNG|nr:hypothetical protein BGZ96_003450 [Linnemannia gamsii]